MISDTFSSVLFSAIGAVIGLYLLRCVQQSAPTKTRGPDGALLLSLPKSPNHITTIDILVLVSRIALKHNFPSFTGYTAPLLRASRSKGSQTFALPSLQVHGALALDDADVRAFQASLRQQMHPNGDNDSPTQGGHPLFLLSQILPLVVHILASRDCPIKPFGAVNTSNKVRCLQPAVLRDWLRLQAAAQRGDLQYHAELRREGVRRKRGMEFCITLAVKISDDLGREGAAGDVTILEVDAFFLMFLPRGYSPKFIESPAEGEKHHGSNGEEPTSEAADPMNRFPLSMTPRDPHAWAATSKDYNPIHISPVGAKVFGFPGVIAHGNHVVALTLQNCSPDSLDLKPQSDTGATPHEEISKIVWQSSAPFELQMSFLRPIVLPAQLDVHLVSLDRPDEVTASNDTSVSSSVRLRINRSQKTYITAGVQTLSPHAT